MTPTDPDFIAAYKLTLAELGIWREGQKCSTKVNFQNRKHDGINWHTYCADCGFDYTANGFKELAEHSKPTPPLSDGLLAMIVRRMVALPDSSDRLENLCTEFWLGTPDCVEAAVLAFANYLRAKEEGPK